MGEVRIPIDFIRKVESSLTKPVFVRIWLSYVSERYKLSEELLQLLEDVPFDEPSELDGELLRDITRTYFENRPFVYGIVTSNVRPPVKFLSDSDVNEDDHIFARPEGSTAEEIPLLYPESVERLLKDLLEFAFIKVAFAKELPKKAVLCRIPPSKEKVDEEIRRLTKGRRVYLNAYNSLTAQLYKKLTRTLEKEMDYEVWELIGYEVNALRGPLRDLVKANVKDYMEELKELIRRVGRSDPDAFLRYLNDGRPIMSYCRHPSDYLRKAKSRDPDRYRSYVEDRFVREFMDLQLEPEKADMSVIYRAIRDRRFKTTAEDLLVHIYKHVVGDDPERRQLFVKILFKALRSHKGVLKFLEKNKLEDLKPLAEKEVELRRRASYLREVHKKVMDLFTEESHPQPGDPVVEEAYGAYIDLLDSEVFAYLKEHIHASVENLVWLFVDTGDLERAEALVRRAMEAGVVSPLFIEITGTLGLKFFERFSRSGDVNLLEKSVDWCDNFYELLYLEEISGSLEREIDLFPRIYDNLVNHLSVKMFSLLSGELELSEDELEEEWWRLAERIEFIEGLFNKYGTKPYEKESIEVDDYLLIKVADEEVSPERLFRLYLASLKLYKVVYLLYSEEEREAKSILREVISRTPEGILEEIDLPKFFFNWGLSYEDLLAEL